MVTLKIHPRVEKEFKKSVVAIEGKGAESRVESRVESVAMALRDNPLSMSEISVKIGRKQVAGALKRLIQYLLSERLIERTIPDKPNSRLQKYRLTKKGAEYLKTQGMK